MEVNAGSSPIRKEEEQLLLKGGQAKEDPTQSGGPLGAEAATDAETEAAGEGFTGGETPSAGLASGLSHLTVASPQAVEIGESAKATVPSETLTSPCAQGDPNSFTLE